MNTIYQFIGALVFWSITGVIGLFTAMIIVFKVLQYFMWNKRGEAEPKNIKIEIKNQNG